MAMEDFVIGIASLVLGARAFKKGMDEMGAAKGKTLQLAPTGHEGPMGLSMSPSGRSHNGRGVKFASVARGDAPVGNLYGVHTLEDRINHIKAMIEIGVRGKEAPMLYKIVRTEIGSRCGQDWCVKERNWEDEVQAIYDFIKANVRYTHDIKDVDTYASPLRTLEVHAGDCDDAAILGTALYMQLGYRVKLRVIRTKGSPDWNHIYIAVGTPPTRPKKWVPIDTTVNKYAGWEAPADMVAETKDFEVSFYQ